MRSHPFREDFHSERFVASRKYIGLLILFHNPINEFHQPANKWMGDSNLTHFVTIMRCFIHPKCTACPFLRGFRRGQIGQDREELENIVLSLGFVRGKPYKMSLVLLLRQSSTLPRFLLPVFL